ncbi:type III pantothenate kinase [Gangjinia marincola]|uniref:Type III pantothenate kinase n=1 Tax=Gangjinia marincola TaxID=578463 RepID=A0ABN1MH79_9FLAO
MNLVIDIGNSRVKLGVFKDNTLIYKETCNIIKLHAVVSNVQQKYPLIKFALVSSVVKKHDELLKMPPTIEKVFYLDSDTLVPFKNEYETPKTLGKDRIALVTNAFYTYENRNCLIIDAGTCITYDILTAEGKYKGGAISPGILMRFKALNNYTGKLPLVDHIAELTVKLTGNSTEKSLRSGVLNGVLFEIEGVINAYKEKYQDLTVILTGGDQHFLSKNLKNSIFATSNFLLEGLNHILAYNTNS